MCTGRIPMRYGRCPQAASHPYFSQVPTCFGALRRTSVPRPYAGATKTDFAVQRNLDLQGPPAEYDLDEFTTPHTERVISREHPELLDLVKDGSLVLYSRPSDYVERRGAEYREPEEIYIVGTAHVSSKSAADVTRVIEALRPDIVVVELCRSRASLLADDGNDSNNPLAMSGESLLASTQRAMSLGGPAALLLRAALNQVFKRLSSKIDVKSGTEFISAKKVAMKLPVGWQEERFRCCHCGTAMTATTPDRPTRQYPSFLQAADAIGAQIVLGDRPIEITLQRCWDAFTWRRRFELGSTALQLLSSPQWKELAVSADDVESLKQSVNIDSATRQMANEVPELMGPLIHERDLYLSWSMKRSKAANGTTRVVGVVGKGHLRGVLHAMVSDTGGHLRFKDLVGGRNTKEFKEQQRKGVVKDLVRDAAIFSILAWAWSRWHS